MRTTMLRISKIHMVGIGGAGMGGIAEVLHNCGYQVTGSDLHKSVMTEHLTKLGIKITYCHLAENIAYCDAVVFSSAIAANNVELVTARSRRIPIVPRAEMLAELMRFKYGIAIAGTHGKTTTTSLIANLLAHANTDPTFVVGGQLNNFGSNARLGAGEYFVAEADESDASFLHLSPMMAVVTNIDDDHLSAYNDDFNQLQQHFIEFLHRLPFYGLAVLCIDDPHVRDIIPQIARPVLTYGFSEQADVRAINFTQQFGVTEFTIKLAWQEELINFTLNLPGKHNVLNALAAIAIVTELGIGIEVIKQGLAAFTGIKRRFQILGEFTLMPQRRVLMLDDYGHHPAEIRAVIAAIRAGWPQHRLVMVFQPHRYSRLKSLFEDFAAVLSEVDVLCLLEVYSAGEAVLPGIDSRALCGSIRTRGKIDPIFVENEQELLDILALQLQDNDILVMQGAGDVSKIAHYIAGEFAQLCRGISAAL